VSVVLGLDVGGSRTRGWLCEGQRVLARAESGSANLSAVGQTAARRALEAVKAGLDGPAPEAVAAGAAGLEAPGNIRLFWSLMERVWPQVPLALVSDVRLVLEAAGLGSGVALVAGTGSIALAVGPDGREARVGGWGHLLGDEGGGYWVAREGMRRALAERDRGEPPGPLATALMEAVGAGEPLELTSFFHSERHPVQWARLAPLVLDKEPELAAVAARELAATAAAAARVAGCAGPVVLAGSLVKDAGLAEQLRRELECHLPGATVSILRRPAVLGAVRVAQRLLEETAGLVP